uniref:Transmembrane protein 107 n=1 Tax=Cryptomonas curvata TaxID=233186 RepID=A0A7S0QDJ6_9CRYP|mmetsp:Transcript_13664/g.29119  ORF Transcript_13664/g.29119 Transcript_13664/m.29119 type:complete len:142 (+) Transcript_13664:133-558(+)
MKTHDTLIPCRFMCTVCFLIATIMVFSTMPENIVASLPSKYTESAYNTNSLSLNFALALNLICLGVSYIGFLGGFSMFLPFVNVVVIISHTIGCIFTCVFIMEAWHYLTFWYIFLFFSMPVAFLDASIIIATFCLGGLNRL